MTNKSLSFSQSIQATQSLMNKIKTEKLDETSIQKEVANIVSTKNGGRGFFVAYLTSELTLADYPSPGIINGLRATVEAIEVTSELLVKNLAMSSAMVIVHSRNDDLTNVRGSQRVSQRTRNLIEKINLNIVTKELEKLRDTIYRGEGKYQSFLEHWKYDQEQKTAIEKAISNTLNKQE